MASQHLRRGFALFALFAAGCGARSNLGWDDEDGSQGGATSSTSKSSSKSSSSGIGGEGGSPACSPGETQPCGSDVGECQLGIRACEDGFLGPCKGAVGPFDELCNGLDDDCNGEIDNGFGLGQACDGPDGDLCFDDVVTCDGCSAGPTVLETCNGTDDNCNGIIDADCDAGGCAPSLLVLEAVKSNPNCVDFPIEKGSMGTINFPCTGGPVSAVLGGVTMSGNVTNGQVSLSGISTFPGPDGCTWQATHTINGFLPSGNVSYHYAEKTISGFGCWQPCTEDGSVLVDYDD